MQRNGRGFALVISHNDIAHHAALDARLVAAVRGIRLLMDAIPQRPATPEDIAAGDSLSPVAPYRVVNIGNSDKVKLLDFIEAIEEATGLKAIRNYMPMQTGDVAATWADANLLKSLTDYQPQTNVRQGMAAFVRWYRDSYQI